MDERSEETYLAMEMNEKLIGSFTDITSSSIEVAKFFLETHRWDLNAAVSTFNKNKVAVAAEPNVPNPSDEQFIRPARTRSLNPRSSVRVSSPSPSRLRARLRSRSPSPPSRARYPLRSNGAGNIRTFADLPGVSGDSDKEQEFYAGGVKSGMIVQDTRKGEDVDESAVYSSRSTSRSFARTAGLLSVTAEPEVVTYTVTIWRNGFTVDDGPLKTLDDPDAAIFLESVQKLEPPCELSPRDGMPRLRLKLIRRQEENFIKQESPKPNTPFQGVGRTLGGSSGFVSADKPPASSTAPPPSMELVVDPAAPITSIQLRLADGTRLVTRFNTHHTVRDVRGFIDASTLGGSRDYQLLIMGFPPKPLPDFDQTIDDAGLANAVLIQKY